MTAVVVCNARAGRVSIAGRRGCFQCRSYVGIDIQWTYSHLHSHHEVESNRGRAIAYGCQVPHCDIRVVAVVVSGTHVMVAYTDCEASQQSISPTFYRQEKWGHYYTLPHFALLDIRRIDNALIKDHRSLEIKFTVINYKNETVMEQVVDWKPATELGTQLNAYECEGIRGPVRWYHMLWVRTVLSTIAFFFLFLPFLTVVWFVGVSVYYVFVASEIKRQDRILQRNHRLEMMRKQHTE